MKESFFSYCWRLWAFQILVWQRVCLSKASSSAQLIACLATEWRALLLQYKRKISHASIAVACSVADSWGNLIKNKVWALLENFSASCSKKQKGVRTRRNEGKLHFHSLVNFGFALVVCSCWVMMADSIYIGDNSPDSSITSDSINFRSCLHNNVYVLSTLHAIDSRLCRCEEGQRDVRPTNNNNLTLSGWMVRSSENCHHLSDRRAKVTQRHISRHAIRKPRVVSVNEGNHHIFFWFVCALLITQYSRVK